MSSKLHRRSTLICILTLSLPNRPLTHLPQWEDLQTAGISRSQIKARNVKTETGNTAHYHDTAVSHVDVRGEGWHYRGLWVLSLARNELLSLGYQPSPMTPRWSSRAVLLFHYRRGSRSMERRHHYPSGLMRLSRCRKRSGNYCWCSFQPGDAKRLERHGGEIDNTHTHQQTNTWRLLACSIHTYHHFVSPRRQLRKLI